ncbi:hypothetical protein HMN09_00986900 [Mycena chlorophos]|uniref:Oxidoreductase AflY n=1 Tax=Mycena chlorophos TaxID=658473 RepID=A0A8H6SJ92_MYCCL|nr:hypothetical protein HMN09_00986900 [Mycena chlorophos]
MDSLRVQLLKPGLVDFPGKSDASARLTAHLVHRDFKEHHCFHTDDWFHDHLTHHILALYDLGASTETIQATFDVRAKEQRDLFHGKQEPRVEGLITEKNWHKTMGEKHAALYPEYLSFFASCIARDGVSTTLEKFLFSPEANANGTVMLTRFFSGAFHPFIHTGLGIEFGQDSMVAQGLALTVLTTPDGAIFMEPSGHILLASLRALYAHPDISIPVPQVWTSSDSTMGPFPAPVRWAHAGEEHGTAIREVYSEWACDSDVDIDSKIDEIFIQAALMLGASAPAPRIDFFVMHNLTSAMALRPLCSILEKPENKAQVLQMYARSAALMFVVRGFPRVDCNALMDYPVVPEHPLAAGHAGGANPWLAILANAAAHPEPHVTKSLRALFYAARRLGHIPTGEMPGALDSESTEIFSGGCKLDGTVFLRLANMVCEQVGWVAFGEEERGWRYDGMWPDGAED